MKAMLVAYMLPGATLVGFVLWLIWKPLAVALGLTLALCLVFWILGRRSK